MNEFKTYHPIVNFTYFAFVIGFSIVLMHPICLTISLCLAFSYSVMLKGRKAVKINLLYMIPTILTSAIVNPAFNHEGITVICYLPSGNPLTLESILYGIATALMLVCVICLFSSFNEVMTSDKFVYLFGKIAPSLSLLLSMALRFVPRFVSQLKTVASVQKCMGNDISSGSVVKRIKNASAIVSTVTTWSLENAIDTADSMKSRGYGLSGRTSFSNFRFDRRDLLTEACILSLGSYIVLGSALGKIKCRYFPSLKFADASPFSISVFAAYFLLFALPIIIEILEVIKWKTIKSKI